MDYTGLPLEVQVAQLFMVGYEGLQPQTWTRRFLETGVGGLIFFRDNFEPRPEADYDASTALTAQEIHCLLHDLRNALPSSAPPPLFGIDQEGGQVERLPHTIFPTTVTPRAVALSPHAEERAKGVYGLMARRLATMGFNLDFFPTLDVNLNPRNPIIGVRAFGDDPETVWRFGRIAMAELEAAGLIAVGKHFPGHGDGTVDSHLDLPTLHFSDAELQPFQEAINAGLPMMLVAHGFYPALQTTPEEQALPSSASPAILQNLLRKQCGFQGVIITDDLCMGAITKHRSPIEAAIAALRAGVDILLYRRSTETEWAVYQAVLEAFRDESLPISLLQQSMARIAALKSRFFPDKIETPFQPEDWTPERCHQEADAIALASVSISGESRLLPLDKTASIWLVHPDRANLNNYAWDVPTSESLEQIFRGDGFEAIRPIAYPFQSALSIIEQIQETRQTKQPDVFVFVAFNALLNPEQATLATRLKECFPHTPFILVSIGTPYDARVIPDSTLTLTLCNYRPASMRALVHVLRNGIAPHNL